MACRIVGHPENSSQLIFNSPNLVVQTLFHQQFILNPAANHRKSSLFCRRVAFKSERQEIVLHSLFFVVSDSIRLPFFIPIDIELS